MNWKSLREYSTYIKNINYFYSVVGHSFIPPGHIFERVEKKLEKWCT